MHNLDSIADAVRTEFETRHAAREVALAQSRELIRYCSDAIRAIHRQQWDAVDAALITIRTAADALQAATADHPDLLYAGYTQDALKEYVEAFATLALVRDTELPTPETLGVPGNTWLNGLCEAASELRRHILDILRHEYSDEAERLLDAMDTIYGVLMTFDFPDAITGGLRRHVDQLRGVLERTRGDMTTTLRMERLEAALAEFEKQVNRQG